MTRLRRRTFGRRVSTFCGHVIFWTAIVGTIVLGIRR